MPYTTTLLDLPAIPAPQGKAVNEDRTPSKELSDYLRRLEAVLETYRAALDELEPP